ncbi:SPOR domain-containing protein [Aurantibacillus circumpalustris]|uniref:SPOR domain-containing protein n=1 Tax=Aurantibacillus circumpalustris TaxID=3036359 RepID=UPI00295A829A|nr:SPOR domain-containing protein [Aurantibacillus circumpalustris]
MKRITGIVCLLITHSFIRGQITMQTNLPKALPLNSEITFEVKINKGNSTNFAKYQMEIPRGTTVKEVDVKSGSFASDENLIKIIWVMAPIDPEFSISLKLTTGVVAGKKTFKQKYFYVENEDKREVEMEPLTVIFKDSVASISVSSNDFVSIMPKEMPSLLTTTINAAEISTKNPELLKQQVLQLKKDSKDAFVIGEKEKRKAEDNRVKANAEISKAELISDETLKKQAMDKAMLDKEKAENDIEVAARVLTLAKSLEDNANEIDAINRSVNPGSYTGQPTRNTTIIAAANKPSSSSNNNETGKRINTNESEKISLSEKTSEGSNKNNNLEVGLVYKIQLGAFSKEPSPKDFKSIGKIKVSEENGMYKVLYGSFASKEEAFKQREQILSKGFDGFVVSYQDGVRVK